MKKKSKRSAKTTRKYRSQKVKKVMLPAVLPKADLAPSRYRGREERAKERDAPKRRKGDVLDLTRWEK